MPTRNFAQFSMNEIYKVIYFKLRQIYNKILLFHTPIYSYDIFIQFIYIILDENLRVAQIEGQFRRQCLSPNFKQLQHLTPPPLFQKREKKGVNQKFKFLSDIKSVNMTLILVRICII